MAKKIFGVYLAKLDAPNSEAHARLELPASPWELHDAMDKVQLQENEELYLEIDDYYGFEYLAPHLMELDASLNELNDLAGQLAVLGETEQEVFDGLLRLEIQRKVESNGGILTMQDLRNLAVSAGADCCHVVGATSDAELGRFYAENGFMEELDGLSDDVFEMLDFGKIGKALRIAREDPKNLAARAKAEKYAKILAKTIVNPDGDDSNRGQNAFFYDAAEGLLTSVILMLAEFLPPDEEHPQERRHIVSVFKLVQDLLEPSKVKGKSHFQLLMGKLPPDHKARWFAGAALNSAEQAMASVMSTVLSRLNAFLDSELEQVLCFDSAIDAEKFGSEKSAIFLILPEEDTTKNFMAGLMIQNLSRELFAVADENGGKLQNRVVLFCDEFGTMPPFDVLPLFSAGRSRRLTLVPIIQSLAQLEKNYGKEGSEIIQDNCQDTIFGGFAPNSQTAEVLSKALGNRTVLSGSVSRGKNDPSQSLQMMERPLLMPDELKSIPKGNFIVQKTGQHPMRTRLRLFLEWGITFEEPYIVPERVDRAVAYANREDLERNLPQSSKAENADMRGAYAVSGRGGIAHEPAVDKPRRRGGKQMKTYGEEDL